MADAGIKLPDGEVVASMKARLLQERTVLMMGSTSDETCFVASHSTTEFRSINNAIKHDGYVDEELSKFPNWTKLKNQELGNVGHLYRAFRADAESYISDLVSKADFWWSKNRLNPIPH